ncbi:hypothetical protein IWQ60_008768 [Tieghemiomyces parasiticus]|uniref:DUF7593 domain-containing protein n=1 Tax=Tieghemiomyces parasiticus TaxID=78921 RepID=A0A9W8DMC8_9FUNG|nr:hypothetical protein IWQ60_008768 [Tieghemiomyces parasiticus]
MSLDSDSSDLSSLSDLDDLDDNEVTKWPAEAAPRQPSTTLRQGATKRVAAGRVTDQPGGSNQDDNLSDLSSVHSSIFSRRSPSPSSPRPASDGSAKRSRHAMPDDGYARPFHRVNKTHRTSQRSPQRRAAVTEALSDDQYSDGSPSLNPTRVRVYPSGPTPQPLRRRRRKPGRRKHLVLDEPNRRDAKGRPQLFYYVERDELEACRALLDHGADIHLTTSTGTTALYEAIDFDCSDVVELLLSRGANPNTTSGGSGANGTTMAWSTPLHLAVRRGDFDTVQLLLRHGATADIPDSKGRSPRDLCTEPAVADLLDQHRLAMKELTDHDGINRTLTFSPPAVRLEGDEGASSSLESLSDQSFDHEPSVAHEKYIVMTSNMAPISIDQPKTAVSANPILATTDPDGLSRPRTSSPLPSDADSLDSLPSSLVSLPAPIEPERNAADKKPTRTPGSAYPATPPPRPSAMQFLPLYTVQLANPQPGGGSDYFVVNMQVSLLLGTHLGDLTPPHTPAMTTTTTPPTTAASALAWCQTWELFTRYPDLYRRSITEPQKERLWDPLATMLTSWFNGVVRHYPSVSSPSSPPPSPLASVSPTELRIKQEPGKAATEQPSVSTLSLQPSKTRDDVFESWLSHEQKQFLATDLYFVRLDDVVRIIKSDYPALGRSLITITVDLGYHDHQASVAEKNAGAADLYDTVEAISKSDLPHTIPAPLESAVTLPALAPRKHYAPDYQDVVVTESVPTPPLHVAQGSPRAAQLTTIPSSLAHVPPKYALMVLQRHAAASLSPTKPR